MEFPKPLNNVWMQRALLALLGGVAGYLYYAFVGCVSGTCPISSNPWLMTGYGTVMGLLLAPRRAKRLPATTEQD